MSAYRISSGHICGVMHTHGFKIDGKFHVRELAAVSMSDEDVVHHTFKVGNLQSNKDFQMAEHLFHHVHGLSLFPKSGEEPHEQDQVDHVILTTYLTLLQMHAGRNLLAIKGDANIANILERLGIPYWDIERWGCLPSEHLVNWIDISRACNHHLSTMMDNCSITKVMAYRRWLHTDCDF